MLRLHPKPPEGFPTINVGTSWSSDDLADLDEFTREWRPVREIAEYLGREVREIEAKPAERDGLTRRLVPLCIGGGLAIETLH